MDIRTKSSRTPSVGVNESAVSEHGQDEVGALKEESEGVVSVKQGIKAFLIDELAGWIEGQHLTLPEATHVFGVTRARMSDVIDKNAASFTADALVDMLLRTGKHIRVVVR